MVFLVDNAVQKAPDLIMMSVLVRCLKRKPAASFAGTNPSA